MFAVEYYSNRNDEEIQNLLIEYEIKLRDFMTNKRIIHILNKKIENLTIQNSELFKNNKISKMRNFSVFRKNSNRIDRNFDKYTVTEKVSMVFNNFNQIIDTAENTLLEILKKQEESFLNKFYEKKFIKKVNYA